ncbi:MAG: aminomethyl-transferring glycine dehydrogenase subunit GcvPA [Acidobacteria bacterium]|nr:MAG: aminomethyl-transferring glycine dehydrogenase subunit GcvPA [Acidobacteriota bacterium]
MRYLPLSPGERAAMLRAIGRQSIQELFEPIPESLRLSGPLKLPGPMSEPEILEFFRRAAEESSPDYVSFLGAGAYSHYRPVAVDSLLSRGEFFTAYTPYQAEIAQGTLQAMFEFQTLMAQLTGMDVANASLYDGSTAATEAVLMGLRILGGRRVLVARSVHPEYRQVLRTYLQHQDVETVEIPFSASGQLDLDKLEKELKAGPACLLVQSPNFVGALEPTSKISGLVQGAEGLVIVAVAEPLSLAVVQPPTEADIVCGEAQSFGVAVAYGGPYVGFLAAKAQYVRQVPGRLVGETRDTEGRRGYVLTLATREQHIRREKATSNICTNQSLCALAATIYLALLGKRGLKALAEQNLAKAHYAAQELAAVPGVSAAFTAPFFNEFSIRAPRKVDRLLAALGDEKIIGGLKLERFYPELKDHVLIAVTETARRMDLDRMVRTYRRVLAADPPPARQSAKATPSGEPVAR